MRQYFIKPAYFDVRQSNFVDRVFSFAIAVVASMLLWALVITVFARAF